MNICKLVDGECKDHTNNSKECCKTCGNLKHNKCSIVEVTPCEHLCDVPCSYLETDDTTIDIVIGLIDDLIEDYESKNLIYRVEALKECKDIMKGLNNA